MILQALGLTKYFPVTGGFTVNKWIKALDGVSVQVAEAETLGIVGESGSGKTTLARLFLLLERPTSGSLLFDGKATRDFGRDDLMRYRRSVQAVFQDPFSSLNPRMRVEDIVAEPLPR
ncbi:MAG: peptide ABC transporter substrate-binding protein, partial [Candidatus Rokuibacteriota bacterium]